MDIFNSNSFSAKKLNKFWLYGVFFTGAVVIAIELLGTCLIAPHLMVLTIWSHDVLE